MLLFCALGTKLTCEAYKPVWVQPGRAFRLPCQLGSNMAKVMWKFNGEMLNSSQLQQYSAADLLIYSMGPDHQGCYECWALEEMGDRSFSWLLRGFRLGLDLWPQSTTGLDQGRGRAMVPKESSASQPLGPNDSVLMLAPPIHLTTVPPGANTPHVEPGEASAKYLQSNGSTTVLLFFTLFFCFLFLATVSYNCYMQYLPGPCLSMRAALLGRRKKSPPQDYQPCETGLEGSVAQQKRANGVSKDVQGTGCEKGPSAPLPSHTAHTSPPTEKPFDADCERQSIEYADADVPPWGCLVPSPSQSYPVNNTPVWVTG